MSFRHYLAIGVTLLLIVGFYLFGQLKPQPKINGLATSESASTSGSVISALPYLEKLLSTDLDISESTQEELRILLSAPEAYSNHSSLVDSLELSNAFFGAALLLESSPIQIDQGRLADLYAKACLQGLEDKEEDVFAREKATELLNELIAANPSDNQFKVRLAEVYTSDQQTVMNGVTLLLEVVKSDSINAGANFLLGKFAIISGQYEKAVQRLEKVISLQSQNAEAYFLLAEAYMGLEQTDKALKTFEECRLKVEDKDLILEIDRIILDLRQKENAIN